MAYQSEIEKLEQRYHENPQQWFAALADSYRKAGDLDLAVEVVRGGLEKRPNYASGHIVLGRCLMDMQQTPEAAAAFQQVLELDAENIIALKSLGEIAEQQGDIAGARDWLSRLLDIDPMNDEARENLERLNEIVVEPPGAEPLAEKPSIEPGAAWAAEAMADINRSAEEEAAARSEETAGGLPGESLASSEATIGAEPAGEEPTPEADLAIERTSWDELHASLRAADPSESEVVSDSEIDAAFPEQDVAVEPVSGLVDAAFQEPGEVEPVSGLVGSSGEAVVAESGEDPSDAIADASAMAGDTAAGAGARGEEGGELKMAGDLEVVSFDDELSWGAGEELSGAISEQDIREAEAHHEDLAPAVEFLGDPEAFGTKREEPSQTDSTDWGAYRAETPVDQVEPDLYAREAGMLETPFDGRVDAEQELGSSEYGGPVGGESDSYADIGDQGQEHDLPLILPELVQHGTDMSGGPEVEPVVTETMGDVYARQGLFEQARETYAKLLEQRPGDAVLQRKLAEVSGQAEASAGERTSRFDVVDTGGQSAVAYLQQVFGSAPVQQSDSAAPTGEGPPDSGGGDRVVSAPESPLQSAFGGAPAEPPGAPTIPASDEVSLSSVFGGEASPAVPASGTPPTARAAEGHAGVSFDAFYGSDREAAASDEATPTAEEEPDEGADDDFRNWLEGLKT